VSADKLREKLAALKAAYPEASIEVSATKTVAFQQVRQVMDDLTQAGLTNVALRTQ